jgi:hypothetical protein
MGFNNGGGGGGGGAGGGGPNSFPALVAPFDPHLFTTTIVIGSGTIWGCRVTVGKTGTLHDIAIPNNDATGNARVGVYDVGVASPAVRTLLWDSGAVALAGVNQWQVIGDPALAVTAGEQLDLVVQADNASTTLLCPPGTLVTGCEQLPPNYLPGGTVSPLLRWTLAGVFGALPATIGNTPVPGLSAICIIGRIALG